MVGLKLCCTVELLSRLFFDMHFRVICTSDKFYKLPKLNVNDVNYVTWSILIMKALSTSISSDHHQFRRYPLLR